MGISPPEGLLQAHPNASGLKHIGPVVGSGEGTIFPLQAGSSQSRTGSQSTGPTPPSSLLESNVASGQAAVLVIVDAVIEQPLMVDKLVVVHEDEEQETQASVTVVTEQEPVSVAVFPVFVTEQPNTSAQVDDGGAVKVVMVIPLDTETPNDVVVEQIEAVSVLQDSSGSSGNDGSPLGKILNS